MNNHSFLNCIWLFLTTLCINCIAFSSARADSQSAPAIELNPRLVLGVSGNADKPRIVRTESGTLVIAYGDSPPEAQAIYDLKAGKNRRARDIYIQTCMPAGATTCDRASHWTPPRNLSNSARSSSISTRHQGGSFDRTPHPGDVDKPNIRAIGPVTVVSWVSKYCPDGDVTAPGIQASQQRAVTYLEREGRELPFSCIWVAYSVNQGATWSQPIQRSTGLRDAIQDSVVGGFNIASQRGWFAQVWQEDPQGLLLGEAEGPGDGASGAQVNGGTDVWYGAAQIDLSTSSSGSGSISLRSAVRLTDNWQGAWGRARSAGQVTDSMGEVVPSEALEVGASGASRPTVAASGSTVLLVYEQSRTGDSEERSARGKLVQFHAFDYRKPVFDPADPSSNRPSGCVVSDPARNGRRARVVAQSTEQAGSAQMLGAIFWREGQANQGGPADIVLRRLVGGTDATHLDPPVDPGCKLGSAGSSGARAENISSNTHLQGPARILEDTEDQPAENAIAHRAILRADRLWLGYLYVSDLEQLGALQRSYDFWLRHYSPATGWSIARNLSRTGDPRINVREPRLVGTPRSGSRCPSGEPRALTTTDPTDCQNSSALWAAWGTQTNEALGSGVAPRDLGILVSASADSGANFGTARGISFSSVALLEEEAAAFETQLVLRPDGRRFRSVWTQQYGPDDRREVVLISGHVPTAAETASSVSDIQETVSPPDQPAGGAITPAPTPTIEPSPFATSSGGCSWSRAALPPDPTLVIAAGLALLAIVGRPRGRSRRTTTSRDVTPATDGL